MPPSRSRGGNTREECGIAPMKHRIVEYRSDEEGEWVAELECPDGFHLRHDPSPISHP